MKREEHYCDHCFTKMSYIDADGETCVQGIITSQEVYADIQKKTDYGSSSSRVVLCEKEFCGIDCFTEAINRWVEKVKAKAC